MKTKVTLAGNFKFDSNSIRRATAMVNFGSEESEVAVFTMPPDVFPAAIHASIDYSVSINNALKFFIIDFDETEVLAQFAEGVKRMIISDSPTPLSKTQQRRKDYRDEAAQALADKIVKFAKDKNLSIDWHEPDNQGVTAEVTFGTFDNAFGTGGEQLNTVAVEQTVIITDDESGEEFLRANLANLFACVCYLAEKE